MNDLDTLEVFQRLDEILGCIFTEKFTNFNRENPLITIIAYTLKSRFQNSEKV